MNTKEKSLSYSEVLEMHKHFAGKTFTLLDSVIVGDRQLKAIKDCVRNYIAEFYSDLSNQAFGIPPVPVAGVDFNEEDLEEISLEEAIGV